jgi:hypothetical protein
LRGVFSPSARALSLDLVVAGHQSPAGVNPGFDFCFACRCTSQSRLPAQLRSQWLGLFLIFLLRQVQPKLVVLVLFLLTEILVGSAPVNSFSAIAVSHIDSLWLGSLPSIVVPHLGRILIGGEVGIALDSSDQKTRGFLVQITLLQRFSKCAHQVFSEITVRI